MLPVVEPYPENVLARPRNWRLQANVFQGSRGAGRKAHGGTSKQLLKNRQQRDAVVDEREHIVRQRKTVGRAEALDVDNQSVDEHPQSGGAGSRAICNQAHDIQSSFGLNLRGAHDGHAGPRRDYAATAWWPALSP